MRKGKIYNANHKRKGTIRFRYIKSVKGDETDPRMWLVEVDTSAIPKMPDWSEKILRPSLMEGDFE